MAIKFNTNVSAEKIKKYLLSRIDKTNPVETEKVGRYINHIEMYRRMEKTVKGEGASITVENASQRFIKSHPLLSEMNKVNAAIMNIERTFNFIEVADEEKKITAEDLI